MKSVKGGKGIITGGIRIRILKPRGSPGTVLHVMGMMKGEVLFESSY